MHINGPALLTTAQQAIIPHTFEDPDKQAFGVAENEASQTSQLRRKFVTRQGSSRDSHNSPAAQQGRLHHPPRGPGICNSSVEGYIDQDHAATLEP